MFSSGTKSTLSEDCGMARGNQQFPGVLDLSNESKTSPSNFLVGLNAQSTRCDILKLENERGGKLYGLLIISD
jgi:hypothetical protein